MEFVSELFDRLEDEERPFPKRMRLAQNAYYATGGSSEKILSWICSRLKSISHEDLSKFCIEWKKLVTTVHNQHIRPLVKLMLEVVNEHLTDHDKSTKDDILNYAVSVLENTRVQNYFFSDLDTYIAFIQTLLSILATRSNQDEILCKKLFETMEAFARMITLREYPVLFLENLLLPSVHLVNSVQPYSYTLERHLLSCIEMAVFFRNTPLLAAYLDALLKSKKKKADQGIKDKSLAPKEDKLKSQAHFKAGFKLLEKLCCAPNDNNKNDVFLTYTAIFKCLAKTNNASLLSFKLLMAICPFLGINVSNAKVKVELPEDLKKFTKSSSDELSFDILYSILSVILKENLSFPNDGELHSVNWIECLWRTVLSVSMEVRRSSAYLRCLTALLHLHPRIVMNRNLPLITDVLVVLSPEKEIPEFVPFLHTLISIHQKRFSVQELLINMFTSSKQLLNTRKRLNSSTLHVDTVVPPPVYKDIQKYAADWTSTPVLDFMDFMVTQLQTLAFTSENQRNLYMDTSTAVAVKLLCGVLSGARVVDHCGNEKIRLAYVNRFNTLSQVLKQMATICKNSQNLVFMRSFLDLESMWAEVAIMLHHYCPQANDAMKDFAHQPIKVEEGVKDEKYSAIVDAISFVHAHTSPADWDVIQTKITNLQDLQTRQLWVRLEVQSLRYFIISNAVSRAEVAAIAREVLPQLVSSMDLESMINDVSCVGKYVQGDELKQLLDKLVEMFFASNNGDMQQVYVKHFSRLQENKSIICGMVFNLLERLENVCSLPEVTENSWLTSQKILRKLNSSGVDTSVHCVSEKWDEVLTSMGKTLNKSFKKSQGSEILTLAELPSVKQILSVLNVIPLEFLPGSLQSAIVLILLGLSGDLLSSEECEDKSSMVKLIYHELIFGILERWPITTEVPPVQKYVNIAQVISHVKDITNLKSDVDVSIVHAFLGMSLKSATSVNKILGTFFSNDEIPEDDFAIQQEMLNVICKDSLSTECREILKSSDCDTRVVSTLSNFIQQQRPKKQFLQIYTLLLSRSLKKRENVEGLLPNLATYCKLSLKSLRNEKKKRVKGEEFVCEVLKYHEVQKHFPPNFFLDLWTVLLETEDPKADIASLLFSAASRDDFESMIQCIMKELECSGAPSILRANVLVMWEALIKSPLISEQNLEKRQTAISFFLAQQHIFLTYPVNQLLKVLLTIVESSKIVVLVYTADHILQAVSSVMSRRNRTDVMSLVPIWFAILNSMLFHRSSQTLDCLPAFTAELRLLIQNVVTCSRQNEHLEECISIAQGLEKMFQTIVKAKLTRNFIRIGAYILADLLKHFEGQLSHDMKVILENIACEILGFLDMYAQRFLGKVVTAESTEILKEIGRIRSLRRSKIV